MRTYLGVSAVFLFIVTLFLANAKSSQLPLREEWQSCQDTCRFSLVETIPAEIEETYSSSITHTSTHSVWVKLISLAQEKIEICSKSFKLYSGITHRQENWKNVQDIFHRLLDAGTDRNISIKIVQSGKHSLRSDKGNLQITLAAELRTIDFNRLRGGGFLNTKMWVVDRKHVYVGSAYLHWRSLGKDKELGFVAFNCSCLANDLGKVFDIYWSLGQNDSKIPEEWPDALASVYGRDNQMNIIFNGKPYNGYLACTPPSLCGAGWTTELDAILDVIDEAEEYIHLSVMEYAPVLMFSGPEKIWPAIDDRLKRAAMNRRVTIRLLVGCWVGKNKETPELNFLKSLQDLNGVFRNVVIEVKYFGIQSNRAGVWISPVSYSQFMVTEKSAFFGSSSWSGDYFTDTAGIGFVVTPKTSAGLNHANEFSFSDKGPAEDDIRAQLAQVFKRDWNSNYTITLDDMLNVYKRQL